MTERIARCEAALLAVVEAMEGAMDEALTRSLAITEAEQLVLYQHAKAIVAAGAGGNSIGATTSSTDEDTLLDTEPPIPSFVSKALIRRRNTATSAGVKRLRSNGLLGTNSNNDADDGDDDLRLLTSLSSCISSGGRAFSSSANGGLYGNLITSAEAETLMAQTATDGNHHAGGAGPASYSTDPSHLSLTGGASSQQKQQQANAFASAQSLAATITDVDRRRLLSSVEAKRGRIRQMAAMVNDAFENLHKAVDLLPDVPLENIEADYAALTNDNLMLRDEVVGLYDRSVALYEECLGVAEVGDGEGGQGQGSPQ